MKHIVILAATLALVSGCGQSRSNTQVFEGQVYSGRAKGETRGGHDFVATVRGAVSNLEGARQAAAYQGTKYCINTFGTSDILWTDAPDAPQEALRIDRDTLTVAGRCVEAGGTVPKPAADIE